MLGIVITGFNKTIVEILNLPKVPEMKTKLYTPALINNLVRCILAASIVCLVNNANAQFRSYSKVFSDNIKGGAIIFGNTLTEIEKNHGGADTAKMNNNRANGNSSYGNDDANIQYVDVDGDTGAGAKTVNSSTADLSLPAGTNNIKLARIYWGGRVKKSEFDLALDTFRRVKIRFGNSGNYTEYAASKLDKNTQGTGSGTFNQYQAYADITAFVQAHGSGSYTAGNVAASIGAVSSGGNYAGWCIVVVYQNDAVSYNSIRVYDGFQQVYNGGQAQISSVTLNGLDVPSGAMEARDAKMGVMVWEGDANLKEDYLKINGTKFYNALNAVDNPWNGTITDTGVHVTNKFPNYTNQMGLDIDQFYVGTGYGIKGGDSTVALEFGTEADQYFPGLFTFQIKTKDPTVIIDKYVADANNNHVAEENEILIYTLKGKNAGKGNANFCTITDTLPSTVSYVPGSMRIISCTGITNSVVTDNGGDDYADYNTAINSLVFRIGAGANGTHGGILAPGEAFEIQYQVTVKPCSGMVPAIINMARINGYSDAGVKSTDDGTAILEPLGGPLPVTLKTFLANLTSSNTVRLNWTTSMEINCRRYDIERSADGKTFNVVGSVNGSGNSQIENSYSVNDNLATFTGSIVYYRLKQIDFDGKASCSKIIAVRLKTTATGLTASPNPFTSYVNINLDWSKNETVSVQVLNMTGKEVSSKSVQLAKGTNYVAINNLSSLPAGMYIIQFNTSEGKIVKQLIKQ